MRVSTEDDHWHVQRPVLRVGRQKLPSVHLRHVKVQQDYVRPIASSEPCEAVSTVVDFCDCVPLAPQELGERFPKREIIVYDEDRGHVLMKSMINATDRR
jgi:hypothetical protein